MRCCPEHVRNVSVMGGQGCQTLLFLIFQRSYAKFKEKKTRKIKKNHLKFSWQHCPTRQIARRQAAPKVRMITQKKCYDDVEMVIRSDLGRQKNQSRDEGCTKNGSKSTKIHAVYSLDQDLDKIGGGAALPSHACQSTSAKTERTIKLEESGKKTEKKSRLVDLEGPKQEKEKKSSENSCHRRSETQRWAVAGWRRWGIINADEMSSEVFICH